MMVTSITIKEGKIMDLQWPEKLIGELFTGLKYTNRMNCFIITR
jgi:hypothetical protein